MPENRERSRTAAAAVLVLTSPLALLSGAADLSAGKRAAGTEHWQGRPIDYVLTGRASSDVQFSSGARECRITLAIDGRVRTVSLKGEDIDVDGEHLNVGSYARASLNAERDFLILNLVTTRSWGASASETASRNAESDTSTTARESTSRSESSGRTTDYQAFGFTDLGDMRIRVRLKGGRSARCTMVGGADRRVISFDIDAGTNASTIVITPGRVNIDGVGKTVGLAAKVLVVATKGSLRVTADEAEVLAKD